MVRVKYRYFLAEVVFADRRRLQQAVTSNDVYKSVRQAVQDSYGDYGIGALKDSIMVKYLNVETNMVIIRAKRDFYRMAQVAMTFVKKIGQQNCFLHTLHIGGTIRACQKFLIQHHRRHLPRLLKECKTQAERDGVQKALLTACLNMEQAGHTDERERTIAEIAGEKM